MEAAGAVLVGALNMGEYAYDFTGENIHDGPSRNPHDPTRMTGGSSGGSGGAVGGALVPIALGSDTNGSIRVPSSFCGIFGLKPTYGRLSRARSFPFVASFDHLGPFARSVTDLALAYDAMQGPDADDAACTDARDRAGDVARSAQGIGELAHRARRRLFPAERLCRGQGSGGAGREGARRHARRSSSRRRRAPAPRLTSSPRSKAPRSISIGCASAPHDFDPAVRDRLIAGAMIPAPLVDRAQKFRRWYRAQVIELFKTVDVIIAPATPCVAPKLGQATFVLDGVELPVRANIGIHTQPISFIGLPVVAVPVPLEPMPIGVQIIAAPWREDIALRVAYRAGADGRRRGAAAERTLEDRNGNRSARRRRRGDRAIRALRGRRWSTTTSPCSASCSATIPARSATASAKISMAMPRSTPSAPPARRSG